MSETDLRTLLTNQRKIAFWASIAQLVFTLVLLGVVLWVRSRDIDELRHAIDEARCQCGPGVSRPQIHNENHINTESSLDRIYQQLTEKCKHDLRRASTNLRTGDVLQDDGRIDPRRDAGEQGPSGGSTHASTREP